MDRNPAKCRLEKDLGAVSFAMDDLRLFLDTHPDCQEALTYFNKLSIQRDSILDKYQQFVVVDAYATNSTKSWDWLDSPWPWEVY